MFNFHKMLIKTVCYTHAHKFNKQNDAFTTEETAGQQWGRDSVNRWYKLVNKRDIRSNIIFTIIFV